MEIMLRYLAVCVAASSTILCSAEKAINRTFEIDYGNDTFLMNGEPFRYISGSVHYFRIPHQYWRNRLKKIKLLGFNAISTYVEWFTHEPKKGQYTFEGDSDLVKFIQVAEEEGLYVIARVGPYICAEREFGGYPAWLLTENPQMRFRTSDPSHTFFVDKWFQELFKRLTPLLYGNGGPIIMVQVENEYGSYARNDKKYLIWLRDLIQSHVGGKALLFTTDGWSKDMVVKGNIPGVFATVDFGTSDLSLARLFKNLRSIQPHGPLVNSEFYTGWLSYWGEAMSTVSTEQVINTMTELITGNVSFNCYMVHGGTNFGFTSGSGSSDIQRLSLTSYDYDAPITEAGDLTEKYTAMRKVIRDHGYSVGTDEDVERLKYSPKGDYGVVELSPKISLLSSPIGIPFNRTTYPQTMEYFSQRYGFSAYTHILKDPPRDPSVLQVNIRDRALVLLDDDIVSVLAYTIINETPLPPNIKSGMKLTLLVENEGRRNYQRLSDVSKGIVGNATLDGAILEGWDTVSYELTPNDIKKIESLDVPAQPYNVSPWGEVRFPMFFTGELTLPPNHQSDSALAAQSVPIHMSNEVIPNMMTSPPLTADIPELRTEAVATGDIPSAGQDHSTTDVPMAAQAAEIPPAQVAVTIETAASVTKETAAVGNETTAPMADETAAPIGNDTLAVIKSAMEGKTEIPGATDIPFGETFTRERDVTEDDHPLDTFLDMRGWGKGVVWMNGYNLGRYWHVGSQKTLYVPGVWLKPHPEVNRITVLELHYTTHNRTLQFVTKPIFEYPPPSVVQAP